MRVLLFKERPLYARFAIFDLEFTERRFLVTSLNSIIGCVPVFSVFSCYHKVGSSPE